jgi:hypothetical protein
MDNTMEDNDMMNGLLNVKTITNDIIQLGF